MTNCDVYINDNIINVHIKSKINADEARYIATEAIPLMEKHKTILHGGIIDLTEASDADTIARKELAVSLEKCSGYLRKVAVYAPDMKRRVVAKIVLTMGGWRDYKMFSDRAKAIDWLKQ